MMSREIPELPRLLVEEAVRAALAEDLGRAGDITSAATIPAGVFATAAIVARRPGVLVGLQLAQCAFRMLDPNVRFLAKCIDGDVLSVGAVAAEIEGNAPAVLSAERRA